MKKNKNLKNAIRVVKTTSKKDMIVSILKTLGKVLEDKDFEILKNAYSLSDEAIEEIKQANEEIKNVKKVG